jgi:hypothetical protein
MIDLTTKLNNYALTCDNRARQCRERAAAARNEPRASNWPEYNEMRDNRARDIDAQAALWERRGDEARRGFLLVDRLGLDLAWYHEFHDLHSEAAKSSRVTYADSADAPSDPSPSAFNRHA